MKKVIAYSSLKNNSIENVQRALHHSLFRDEFEIHRNLRTLSRRLRQPGYRWHIALLAIDTPEELDKILSINELLSDLRILLILSDQSPKTISKGLQLVPRLITYKDGNFRELTAVLKKMIRKIRSSEKKMHHANEGY